MNLSERKIYLFWRHVSKSDGCWNWTGSKSRTGYGRFSVRKGPMVQAHRVAYLIAHGNLPPDGVVCHCCDNPSCVRPEHLFLGTQADNLRDAREKGRLKPITPENSCARLRPESMPRGEVNGRSKLTADAVREIRRRASKGVGQRAIGRAFSVHNKTISNILAGVTWRHVA